MAPQGLVISKLGVQASASGTDVTGLIALKISLPRDIGTKSGARWMIFNSTASPPAITSQPQIHPLPLPHNSTSDVLSTACRLLSISSAPSYPPSSQSGTQPYIDVSSTTGKVYVVVDATGEGSKQRRGSFKGSGAEDGRRDWLVVLPVSQPLEKEEDGLTKVLLPLPRCLDNVIRFRILSPGVGEKDASEVSILTDPKLLALPDGTFGEEGDDNFGTVTGQNEDEGSSWLEGRFQSTDALRLEWSFISSMIDPTTPALVVSPSLHPYPQIALQFSACAPTSEPMTSLEASAPSGWVWKALEVEGEGLAYWRGVDNDWGTVDVEDDTLDFSQDDSFATVRPGKSSRPTLPPSLRPTGNSYLPPPASGSSVSLMRQTLPIADELGEFSFEMSGEQSPVPKRPNTPLGTSPVPSTPSGKGRTLSFSSGAEGDGHRARGGTLFDLYWQAGCEDRGFVLTGILVPESLTFVPATLPQPIPLFSFLSPSPPSTYKIHCPNATYHSSQLPIPTSDPQLVPLVDRSVGMFAWHDSSHISTLRARESKTRVGDVKIRVQRDAWGMLRMNVLFSLSSRQEQTGFRLSATDVDRTRIVRASVNGMAVPRCILPSSEGVEVRMGRKEGSGRSENRGLAEIVLEIGGSGIDLGLPVFEGEGEGRAELVGEGWEGVQIAKSKSLSALSATTFTYPFSTSNPPTIALSPPSSAATLSSSPLRTLFSLSTFYHLFILWLLLSMGSQVQRLRNEVAFVAGEARDLRGGYGWYTGSEEGIKERERVEVEGWREGDVGDAGARIASDPPLTPPLPEQQSPSHTHHLSPAPLPTTVSVWQDWPKKWGRHPTVRTLGKGVKWIWEAVVWLVLPPGV
ncbi:hypothetical protein IAR50_007318 [Cryptococcus sp. DSM 104548]